MGNSIYLYLWIDNLTPFPVLPNMEKNVVSLSLFLHLFCLFIARCSAENIDNIWVTSSSPPEIKWCDEPDGILPSFSLHPANPFLWFRIFAAAIRCSLEGIGSENGCTLLKKNAPEAKRTYPKTTEPRYVWRPKQISTSKSSSCKGAHMREQRLIQ